MSQDHRQLDDNPICSVLMPLIQSSPLVTIPVLQGVVRQSYHFKSLYRMVWMVKQKAIAHIYGDWTDQFNKVFLAFSPCVKDFKHCKPFVSIDGMHMYDKYGGVLLIAMAQDSNSNILPMAFAIVESETTES
nr:uncharacterized protein LOC112786298 [Arachis hypogaea]